MVRLCSCPESSRHVSTYAFLGTAQSCKVSEFQSYHICCFRWFFRPVEKQKTWLEALFTTRSCFSCVEDLQAVLSLAAENCKYIQSHGNLLGFHTHYLMAMAITKNLRRHILLLDRDSIFPRHFANASFWSARNPCDQNRTLTELNCRISGLEKCRGFSLILFATRAGDKAAWSCFKKSFLTFGKKLDIWCWIHPRFICLLSSTSCQTVSTIWVWVSCANLSLTSIHDMSQSKSWGSGVRRLRNDTNHKTQQGLVTYTFVKKACWSWGENAEFMSRRHVSQVAFLHFWKDIKFGNQHGGMGRVTNPCKPRIRNLVNSVNLASPPRDGWNRPGVLKEDAVTGESLQIIYGCFQK